MQCRELQLQTKGAGRESKWEVCRRGVKIKISGYTKYLCYREGRTNKQLASSPLVVADGNYNNSPLHLALGKFAVKVVARENTCNIVAPGYWLTKLTRSA